MRQGGRQPRVLGRFDTTQSMMVGAWLVRPASHACLAHWLINQVHDRIVEDYRKINRRSRQRKLHDGVRC
jgi:hypothetical protein